MVFSVSSVSNYFGMSMQAISKRDLYAQLAAQLSSLLAGERDLIANAANFSSLIFHALPDLIWAGFYFARVASWCWARSRASPLVCESRLVRVSAALAQP